MKVRSRLAVAADEIARWDLRDARLKALPGLLREHGVLGQDSWLPMMLIRYQRDRFVEPVSRSRVSLDTEIAAVAADPRLLSAGDCSPLAAAVLEVKGLEDRLPLALRSLLRLGIHKRSFSKFLAVYAHMTHQVF